MNARDWALLILLSVLWGGSFFFIAVAVKGLPPMTVVFLRCAIGALGLYAVMAVLRIGLPVAREHLFVFAVMGILNNVVPQSLIVWAQGSIPSGLASILNATTPMFAVLCLHVLTVTDRATAQKWIGVGLGFVGVALMMGLDLLADGRATLLPQVAMLGASLFYGLSAWWGKRMARIGAHPIALAAGQLTASSLILAPLTLVFENPLTLPMPGLPVWTAVVGLALVSTALAYIVYFRILASAGPTNLSLVTLIIPVSAILLGVVFLGESLRMRHLAGMAVIGAGLLVIDGRLWRRFRGRA